MVLGVIAFFIAFISALKSNPTGMVIGFNSKYFAALKNAGCAVTGKIISG